MILIGEKVYWILNLYSQIGLVAGWGRGRSGPRIGPGPKRNGLQIRPDRYQTFDRAGARARPSGDRIGGPSGQPRHIIIPISSLVNILRPMQFAFG